MTPNLCSGMSRDLSTNPTQTSRIQSNRPVERETSLRASSPRCPGGKAGKGRRAGNSVSGIWISASKKSMWNADWRRWRVVQSFFTFVLDSASHWSVDREPQGNWRWISNYRDIVASSFLFPPRHQVPWRACSQAREKLKTSFNLEEFCSAI